MHINTHINTYTTQNEIDKRRPKHTCLHRGGEREEKRDSHTKGLPLGGCVREEEQGKERRYDSNVLWLARMKGMWGAHEGG